MHLLSLLACAALAPTGALDHRLNRGDYEAIVALADAQPLAPGASGEWFVDDLGDPAALRPVTDADRTRGAGAGHVWAVRGPDGALAVFIETVDRGHAGEYGYAWMAPGAPGWDPDALGERWTLDRELSGGWWLISYRLG